MLMGVIFDLDGILVDSHHLHIRAWKRLFSSLGKPVYDDEVEYLLDGHRREQILCHYLGELSAEEIQDYGATKDKFFREEVQCGDLQPIPGVLEFISELEKAGLSKAVATSGKRARAQLLLHRLGILERFSAVVSADDVSENKSDPRIFHMAGERLQLQPMHLLVAEDSVSGVQGAKRAGMRCLAVSSNGKGQMLRNAGADKVVEDFRSVSLADLQLMFAL